MYKDIPILTAKKKSHNIKVLQEKCIKMPKKTGNAAATIHN